MPIDLSQTIDMSPVATGDMTEIPPDMPAGHWLVAITVEARATKGKDSDPTHYPMLMLKFTAEEAYTEGNEGDVGKTTTLFVTFFPETHPGSKMSRGTTKAICEAYEDLPALDTSSLQNDPPTFESIAPWVEALESQKRAVWTTLEKDRRSGLMVTKVNFHEVGAPLKVEEEPQAPKTPAAKANGAPKVNGKAPAGKAKGKR